MAEWLRRLTRNQMGSSRVGSNPTRSVGLAQILERLQYRQKRSALSGNRTPVSRVAGENSTTEPTMRGVKSKSNLSNRIALFTYLLKRILHCRGIEPRSPAWQARILPLNQQCSTVGRVLRDPTEPIITTHHHAPQKDNIRMCFLPTQGRLAQSVRASC